ncbi:MAG: family ATPase [Bacteroidota bacterium]|nr:family ATPase [Bacteroidota bacterium]
MIEMEMETINDAQLLATEFVLHTFANVFVTGKAGTGKTTFLKSVQHNSVKNTVVAAPTGVAAINAGGMTLHSLFQLPFGPFLPTKQRVPPYITNLNTLFENLRLSKAKVELFKELELLIIDEVSMLRCDTLDCIDTILRTVRKNQSEPFGGVQVLFIGDLFQLPPVVNDEEWKVMQEFYESPFFFNAKVISECNILNIEFTKIYRQSEEKFIHLLNKVRNNEMDEEGFYMLNERHQPEALSDVEDYITLTTHNYKADKINQSQLQKLEADPFEFIADVSGDFSEKAYPTEENLVLKTGAQVMFIKNDSNPEKRYFNGKLATVKSISKNEITVQFLDDDLEFVVEKETWENVKYNYNPATDKIEEDKIGSFTQYPVRLAWAITIHKSQGLTFEKAVIDAGQAFAAGQVYVALSRCRTLNGMFLMTSISQHAITTDARIVTFTENYLSSENDLQQQLPFQKIEFAKTQLVRAFDWNKTVALVNEFSELAHEKQLPEKEKSIALAKSMLSCAVSQKETADKFSRQLQEILKQIEKFEMQQLLQERVLKSIHYFGKNIAEQLIQPLHAHILFLENKKRVRGFLKKADELEQALISKLKQIEKLQFGDTAFYEGHSFYKQDMSFTEKIQKKPEKGESQRESLRMYKEGKMPETIAEERALSVTTIETHLSQFVASGDVDIYDFVTRDELNEIKTETDKHGMDSLSAIKSRFGNKYTFGQLRFAQAFLSKEAIATIDK